MRDWTERGPGEWVRADGVEIRRTQDGHGRVKWYIESVPDPRIVMDGIDGHVPSQADSAQELARIVDLHWPLTVEDAPEMGMVVLCFGLLVGACIGGAIVWAAVG